METLEGGLTREEVVKLTTLSLGKVDALIASGELPASKVGRRVVIQPRHVRELLEKNAIRPPRLKDLPTRKARVTQGADAPAGDATQARNVLPVTLEPTGSPGAETNSGPYRGLRAGNQSDDKCRRQA